MSFGTVLSVAADKSNDATTDIDPDTGQWLITKVHSTEGAKMEVHITTDGGTTFRKLLTSLGGIVDIGMHIDGNRWLRLINKSGGSAENGYNGLDITPAV